MLLIDMQETLQSKNKMAKRIKRQSKDISRIQLLNMIKFLRGQLQSIIKHYKNKTFSDLDIRDAKTMLIGTDFEVSDEDKEK